MADKMVQVSNISPQLQVTYVDHHSSLVSLTRCFFVRRKATFGSSLHAVVYTHLHILRRSHQVLAHICTSRFSLLLGGIVSLQLNQQAGTCTIEYAESGHARAAIFLSGTPLGDRFVLLTPNVPAYTTNIHIAYTRHKWILLNLQSHGDSPMATHPHILHSRRPLTVSTYDPNAASLGASSSSADGAVDDASAIRSE